MRVLIVEDEITLNKTLVEGLQEYGYQADSSENFKDAEYYIGIRNYDLVLTDWMLPDGDGVDLVTMIKQKTPRTACVVLSAKDDKESEIKALKAGADDYIKKPFDFDILVARIEARLRFGGTNVIKIDDLVIDPDEEKITYKNIDIEPEPVDFDYIDQILFTSASTVRVFMRRFGTVPRGVKVYCLGQPTLDEATRYNIQAELLPSDC